MIVAAAKNFSLLVNTLRNCADVINDINQECAQRGLPPAFSVSALGKGFIHGNKDYSFQGFGVAFDSVLPPKPKLTFWVHYRINSDEHIELGRFSCPLKLAEVNAVNLLGKFDFISLDEVIFDDDNDTQADSHPWRNADESDISLPHNLDNFSEEEPLNSFEPGLDREDQVGDFEPAVVASADVENFRLRAIQNTVFKISNVPSPELSDDEKVNFALGSTVPLVSFQELNDHIKVTLANTTLGGRKTWVVYKEHVEITQPNGTKLIGQYDGGSKLPTQVNLSVPWYSQRDNQYRPSATCNVTCVAMVLAYFGVRPKSQHTQLEDQLYMEVTESGTHDADKNSHDQLDGLIKSYGLRNKFSTSVSWEQVKAHLANGNPVIMSGYFTRSGHLIVLRGYDETGFWVNDPWGEWTPSGYQKKSGENLHYSYKLCRQCSKGANTTWAHLPSDPNRVYHPAVAPVASAPQQGVAVPNHIQPSEMPGAELAAKAAQAIVNIFETGRVQGNYSSVVCHPEDPGGLTYGRSQTTIKSGNLFLLIKAYCEENQAKFASELRPYLDKLASKAPSLACASGSQDLKKLTKILEQAGADPIMQTVQDDFFERAYWLPAVKAAKSLGIHTPLGQAVVYDSFIHGSWQRMRDRTIQNAGPVNTLGEQAWIKAYVETRHHWLANHEKPILRKTVYRMEAFQSLIQQNNWNLEPPFTVRGCRVDLAAIAPTMNCRTEVPDFRVLKLASPYMSGDDVQQVQQALKSQGYFPPDEVIDGCYGPKTEYQVKAFQDAHQLRADGIVGPQTWQALGL